MLRLISPISLGTCPSPELAHQESFDSPNSLNLYFTSHIKYLGNLEGKMPGMQIRSLKISALALALACFSEFAVHADPPANNLCATISNTSDYMNCLRSVNPTLAKHIDSAPGGADGYFNKLSSITGIPVSQWISNKNPPTPDQVVQALSRHTPEHQSWLTETFHKFEQAVSGGKVSNSPMAGQPAAQAPSNSSEPEAQSLGSKIASIFGSPSTPADHSQPQQQNSQQQNNGMSTAARNADAIAQDPGISIFKRVEHKYQEITPRLIPGSGPATLKDWGTK